MEKVIYSERGGLGMILTNENEDFYIKKESLVLHGEDLIPGTFTDMDGYFLKPIRFCGLLKNENTKVLVFHTGDVDDLFFKTSYYYCVYWINENRIANTYSYGTVRDFHWKDNRWK